MNEMIIQTPLKLFSFTGVIATLPGAPTPLISIPNPLAVFGMDEIRIVVPFNNGPSAQIRVFEGVTQPANPLLAPILGQTHIFTSLALAGIAPIPPNPVASCFTFKVCAECIAIDVAWTVGGGTIISIAAYAMPGV